MTRRFLTAEDVQRTGGPEIVVDEGTVVTPQALEAARAAGIAIRSAAGPYREPPPDRGPDAPGAEGATRALPNLPEPSDDPHEGTSVVVTAVGRNRTGQLAELTAAVAACQGSVHNVSQRVVDDYFHLILVVELPPGAPFEELKNTLECLGGPEDYAVRVMHERVYRFMHRI